MTDIEILRQTNTSQNRQIIELRDVLKAAQKQYAKDTKELQAQDNQLMHNQHLIFSMLHSFGPTVTIKIDDFEAFMSNKKLEGTMNLDDDGSFSANLTLLDEQ